jgi:hypothetical protein
MKLKNILNEIQNKVIYYHVAPLSVRDSIKKFGLDPDEFGEQRTTWGNVIYLFKTFNAAKQYKYYFDDFDKNDPYDIWEVDITGLKTKKDLTLHPNQAPDDDPDSVYIKGPISRKRLQLIK